VPIISRTYLVTIEHQINLTLTPGSPATHTALSSQTQSQLELYNALRLQCK